MGGALLRQIREPWKKGNGVSRPGPHARPIFAVRQKCSFYPTRGAAAARNIFYGKGLTQRCVKGWLSSAARCFWRGAEDMTFQMATRSCLVLAPHPDNETLGCGATIMRKLAAGTRVD